LSSQLGKTTKGGNARPKGKNGKGAITGYIAFSMDKRPGMKKRNPDLKFTEISKNLGKMWQKLSEKQQDDWKQNAQKRNAENGLQKEKAPPTKDKTAKSKALAVVRHKASKRWIIQGTTFVVQSPQRKIVIGKVSSNGTKVVRLSSTEIKNCKAKGLTLKATTTRKPSTQKIQEKEDDDETDNEN